MSLLERAALKYAQMGYPVFPCVRDTKKPLTEHGFKDASRDSKQIRQWWSRWPEASVGIPTGKETGIVVLDVDPRHGGDNSFADLEAKHGKLPDTWRVLTGSGGFHDWFRHPGGSIPSSAGKLAPGLDVKADGGYVIVPPSGHESGNLYRWEVTARIGEMPLASIPGWLLGMMTAPSGGGTDAPEPDLSKLSAGVPEGERDVQLFRFACYLRRLGYIRTQAEPLLVTAAARCRPPFPRRVAIRKWRWS